MIRALKRTSGILFTVVAIVFGFSSLASKMLENKEMQSYVQSFLNLEPGKTETIETGKPNIPYKTWYSSTADALEGGKDIAKAAEAEGAVLLKNDNNALPLADTDKVSLYGVVAYDPMYSLDGAGGIYVDEDQKQYFDTELEEKGVEINSDLATYYKDNVVPRGDLGNGKNYTLNEISWDSLPASKTGTEYKTAVYVVGRMTNEAVDLTASHVSGLNAKNNDYLIFNDAELSVLQGLKSAKSNGDIDKIVLIFNQANPMEEDLPTLLDEYSVDSAMWVGFTGTSGISAVIDLLKGTSNPSGSLSTAWYSGKDYNPSMPNYAISGDVLMQEGIYVGYKYAETRYEDVALNRSNAGTYDYSAAISYPFGYGLSYTSFSTSVTGFEPDTDPEKNYDSKGNEVSDEEKRQEGDDYTISVEVTNTGSLAGKKTVEIYAQKPYTEKDVTDGVEKPAVELIGFGKTKKLEPGERETLTIDLDFNKYLASFDSKEGNYILEEGTYYITAASNAHEAVNNILSYKSENGVSVNTSSMDTEFGAGDQALVRTYEVDSERSQNYSYYTLGKSDVTSLFGFADPNVASGNDSLVTYMSRNNWTETADNQRTTATFTHSGTMDDGSQVYGGNNFTDESVMKEFYPEVYEELPDEYPTYGANRTDGVAEIQLYEMAGIEYSKDFGASDEDVAKWEAFMDQLTWEETATLVSNGRRETKAISAIGKPHTYDVNASNGISWKFNLVKDDGIGFSQHFDAGDSNHYPTGYPCEGIIASTFNKELAEDVGRSIGEDSLWSGASGLYGFGLGLHRNPYHGRTGEYYSDDPYLTGVMAGYESRGAMEKGLYVYNKHFILNDQETNRTGYSAWLNEQTFRETYLRPFEIAMEIGRNYKTTDSEGNVTVHSTLGMNVMVSFNKIGSYWSGSNYNLMTKCLRNEFGMKGFAVTDWYRSPGMSMTTGLLAGTDLPDGSDSEVETYGPETGGYGVYAQACRRAAMRILYTVANSNAMNFYGNGTYIKVYPAPWLETKDKIFLAIDIIFGVSALFLVGTYVADFILRRKEEKTQN